MPDLEELKRKAIADMGLDPDKYSFDAPPQPALPPANDSTASGAAYRGAKRALIPTLAGTAGTAAAVALMPETAGLSGLLIPLLAGAGAGYGAGYVQEKYNALHSTPEEAAQDSLQYQKDVQKHPWATIGGELAPSLVAFKPSFGNLKAAGSAIAQREWRNPALLNVGLNTGLGALQETAIPALRGEDIDWRRAAGATLGGALMSEPNRVGRWAGFKPTMEAHASPEAPLQPDLNPRVGYDQPIGPDELLGNRLTRDLTPEDSANTRLYRARYGDQSQAVANPNAAFDAVAKIPTVGHGDAVSAPWMPVDAAEAFKDTLPNVEAAVPSAEDTHLKRIAYLEKQVSDAQDSMSRMPFHRQINVVPMLDEMQAKLAKEKASFQAKVEAQRLMVPENAIPLSDAVNQASRKTVYVGEQGDASVGPLGRVSDKKPLETLPEKVAGEQSAAKEVAQDRALADKIEQPATTSAKAIDKSLPQAKLTPEQSLEIAKQIWLKDPQNLAGKQPVKPVVPGQPKVPDVGQFLKLKAKTQASDSDHVPAGTLFRVESHNDGGVSVIAPVDATGNPIHLKNSNGELVKGFTVATKDILKHNDLHTIDPQTKFQFQEAIKDVPAEHLLTHSANADILAATEKLAERHNVTLKRNDTPVLTPEGKLAAGTAEISKRLASYNGNLATVDTGLHEISHVFLDDLRTSLIPSDRALYERGLALFAGNEEKLTQAVGLRSTDLLKNRIEGNLLARFKAWAQDFWSLIKHKWAKATPEDLKNLMARRMVHGEAIEHGEIAPRTAAERVRFQTAEEARAQAKSFERSNELQKNIRKNDFTIPGMRGILEAVRDIPFGGEHLYKAFHKFYSIKDDVLGKYKSNSINLISEITPKEAHQVAERFMAARENPNFTPSAISPKADRVYTQLRNLMDAAGHEANQRGIKVADGDEFRELFITGKYIPHLLSGEAAQVISNKVGSPEFNRLRKDFIEWSEKGGLKGASAAMTEDQAKAAWREFISADINPKGREEGGFAPLEKASGIGLPPSMREMDLSKLFGRYFERYAQKVAWYESVEKHTPENSITRTLLDKSDAMGSKEANATKFEDGKEAFRLRSPSITYAIRDMFKDYDRLERVGESLSRFIRSLMMQTVTGATDFISSIPLAAQHLRLSEYITLLPKAAADISNGIKMGYRWNVIQAHANRLQSPSETSLRPTLMMADRLSGYCEKLDKLSDTIYRITGRDSFEKWGRGLLMSLGTLKTESVVGKLRANQTSAHDVQWMDSFFGKGTWEKAVKEGTITREMMEQAGSKFVQSVQGKYDARDLPAWALFGPSAPFFSLARWNIEKANNFVRYVINPMGRGDFAPFLKMAGLGLAGGELITAMRELINGHKPQSANWDEIEAAQGEGWQYRVLASMSYSGFSGIFADVLRQGMEMGKGQTPQGFRAPLYSAVANIAQRGGQLVQAVEQGENLIDAVTKFPIVLAKDHIQMARALVRFTSEEAAQDVERSNAARDLRVFRDLHGIPQAPLAQSATNPFANELKREYQRTDEPAKALEIARQLIRTALDKGNGDYEMTRNLLANYRSPNSDLMPSLESTPGQFMYYLNWLARTQGEDAKQQALQGYVRKQQMDHLKGQLIPRL